MKVSPLQCCNFLKGNPMKRFAILAGAAVFLVGNVAAQTTAPGSGPVMPPIGGSDDLLTSPFLLNLPAGINLISSPLDTGTTPVRKAFGGMGSQWPFIYEWDSSLQQFFAPGDAMLTPGAGYWYYTPAPTTLVIRGEPYHPLSDLTKDIVPGWHLVGVPFLAGIPWQNFQLYAAGNPVGIETAKDLGWIGPNILTMQGFEWQEHVVGQPFEPGSAYWIETTVPLSLRAKGSAQATPPQQVGSPLPPPDVINVLPKYLDKLAKGVDDMVKVGKDVAAGKLTTGGFKGGGVVFGLANAAIQRYRYENIMDDLNGMDDKLDELLIDVVAIQNQLGQLEAEIEGLENYITVESTLAPTLYKAQGWLDSFYNKLSETGTSYNWGRWSMAGCDLGQSTCDNEITDESTKAFNDQYVLNPTNDPPTKSSDDFYLWWAYAVTGESGFKEYTQDGSSARNLVESIYSELTFSPIGIKLPLQAYMEYVFNQSGCATDVTNCDLYAEVYEPVEGFFQQLVAYQVNLVQAIVDAYSVLASTEQNQTTHTYDNSITTFLTAYDGFVAQLADEAEIFLQVAEQIALYRAADGRFDWSTFGTSDAGQLLARADFVAARLAAPSGGGKPWPWPPGVTGRIFYTQQQPLPSVTQHQACLGTTCTTLTEQTPEVSLTGNWPYLQWTVVNGVAQGTATQKWKVRRLIPQALAAGTYQVASVNPQYGNANLLVAEYGSDYSNPPTDPTDAVLFGSFNGLEGKLGVGALGANWVFSGGGDDSLRDFTVATDANSTTMSVTYKQAGKYGDGNWYEKAKIQIPANSLFDAYPRVRLFWPATITIDVNSYFISGVNCTDHYYQNIAQSLKLLEADGDVKPGTDNLWQPCGTRSFERCSYVTQDRNGPMLLQSDPVTLNHSEEYTLRAHFNDTIWGYYYNSNGGMCQQGPTSGSHVTWTLFNPTFTLTK
jgi:hypothetical protein